MKLNESQLKHYKQYFENKIRKDRQKQKQIIDKAWKTFLWILKNSS